MFRAALESLKIGDPFDETVTLGPLSSEAALTLLLKQVDEAVAHGAKILTGGKRVNRKGSFPLRSLERSEMMHHTLADGGRGNFYRAFSEVTTAQAELSPENAALEIDRLILTAWRRKLPVYLELPSDISYIETDVPEEPLQLTAAGSNQERLQTAAKAILARLEAAKSPAFLLDLDADRFGVLGQIERLARKLKMPVAVLNTCKSAFDAPLFAGVYLGVASSPATRHAVERSDCLFTVGLRRLDSTSAFFTDAIPTSAIHLNARSINLGLENYQGVNLCELLETLIACSAPASRRSIPNVAQPTAGIVKPAQESLTQAQYWKALEKFLRPGDVILAEDGTSNSGATEMRLPAGCSFVTQAVWGSIGYTVGALLGTLCAAPERRHILFVGDGSFQLTAQELSTILRHDLKPFIFLIGAGCARRAGTTCQAWVHSRCRGTRSSREPSFHSRRGSRSRRGTIPVLDFHDRARGSRGRET